jgi:hypothetical protein
MKLIDIPKFVTIEIYHDLIEKIISKASTVEEILSVYQIGSISNPGISDIDILFIFKDGSFSNMNFTDTFTKEEKYILTHSFFVCYESQISSSLKNTYFTNFKLLLGKDLAITNKHNSEKNTELKQQIALEFLSIFYISISIQLQLNIFKLRAFLLSVKAIQFDLKLLEIKEPELENKINWFIMLRNEYFHKKISEKEIKSKIIDFYDSFFLFLNTTLIKRKLYFSKTRFKISKNIVIVHGSNLGFNHTGLILPSSLSFVGKKYINIQQKWQTFLFKIPFELDTENNVLKERMDFLVSSTEINKINFPNFTSLSTGLNYNYEKN